MLMHVVHRTMKSTNKCVYIYNYFTQVPGQQPKKMEGLTFASTPHLKIPVTTRIIPFFYAFFVRKSQAKQSFATGILESCDPGGRFKPYICGISSPRHSRPLRPCILARWAPPLLRSGKGDFRSQIGGSSPWVSD